MTCEFHTDEIEYYACPVNSQCYILIQISRARLSAVDLVKYFSITK